MTQPLREQLTFLILGGIIVYSLLLLSDNNGRPVCCCSQDEREVGGSDPSSRPPPETYIANGTDLATQPKKTTVRWDWLKEMPAHFQKITSQGGQDGVLSYIFENIGTTNKYFVEFGFNSPDFNGGTGANTYQLYLKGWKGLLMDGGNSNPSINLHTEFITPENIVGLFDKHNVPLEPDFVSIDIDSMDLWVLQSLLNSKYKPRVVSVEYNAHYPLYSQLTIDPDSGFSADVVNPKNIFGTITYGASLGAISSVASEAGYSIVTVVTKLDAFLVRNDLLEDYWIPPYTSWKSATVSVVHPPTPRSNCKYLIDFEVWERTHSKDLARKAACEEVDTIQRAYYPDGQFVLDEPLAAHPGEAQPGEQLA